MTPEQVREIELREHLLTLNYFVDRCELRLSHGMNEEIRKAQTALKKLYDLLLK